MTTTNPGTPSNTAGGGQGGGHRPAPSSARRPVVLAWQAPWLEKSFPSFQAHADLITHISPTWFTIDRAGKITSTEDKKTRPVADASGSLLVPLIANEKFNPDIVRELVDTAEKRAGLARRLAELVADRRFDGLNLDFEGPFGSHRTQYAEFAQELGWHMRKAGKELSADVVCQASDPAATATSLGQPSGSGTAPEVGPASRTPDEVIAAWAAAFDYRALGEAVDLFILMGYDYHGRLSGPGPVSSVKWLRAVLAHTLERVPAAKVVLGLPFYGRRWDIDRDGRRSEGKGIFWDDTVALRKAHTPATTSGTFREGWDEDAQSPWFSWEDEKGRHVVHHDDATSLDAKLRLAPEYGLAGAAFWCLSGEPPEMWAQAKATLVDNTNSERV